MKDPYILYAPLGEADGSPAGGRDYVHEESVAQQSLGRKEVLTHFLFLFLFLSAEV